MKKIIKDILSKKLCRDNDKTYSGGFYDIANEIENGDNHGYIFDIFWEIHEETTKQILEAQNEKLRKLDLNTYTAKDLIRENEKLIDKIGK